METHTIDLKKISIPHTNRERIDQPQLDELTLTIKERGLLQPVIVAAHPTKKNQFELIAGERRLLAAQKLGWLKIDARILTATDDEIKEIRLIENLQRVDLTPWEEAAQLAELSTPGVRIEDLALRIGRSPQWCAVRLALGKLIPELRAHVVEQDWPLGHLPLLARIPVEQQPALLAAICACQGLTEGDFDPNFDWTDYDRLAQKTTAIVPTRRQLEEFLAGRQRLLSGASWKLDDTTLLSQAGACSLCPKRSGAQPLLFPELADAQGDTCLDDGCWDAKQAALINLNVALLLDKGKQPVFLKGNGSAHVSEATMQALGPVTVEPQYKFEECKKSDPGAVPAVIVSGEKAGTMKYVKPHGYDSPSGNGSSSAKPARAVDPETGKKEGPSTKERLATLQLKRQCLAVELWAAKLESLKPKFTGLVDALLLHFGTVGKLAIRNKRNWDDFSKHKTKLNEDGWAQLWPVFQARLDRTGPMEAGGDLWQEARSQAVALGVESVLKFCWVDACVDIALPKVLADQGVKDEKAVPE